MDREERRTVVRVAVQAAMGVRGWNIAQLRDATGVDNGTLGDFLAGQRWPQIKTLGKIEDALGWPPGSIPAMLAGAPAPDVGAIGEDPEPTQDSLLYRRPDGLTDEQWEQVKEESRGFIEWQIERAARER